MLLIISRLYCAILYLLIVHRAVKIWKKCNKKMCMAIISKFSSLYFTFIFLYSFKMCIFSISEQKQEETTLLFCLIPTSRRTYLYNLRNYLHITALYLPILKRFLKLELICSTSRYLHLISISICIYIFNIFKYISNHHSPII